MRNNPDRIVRELIITLYSLDNYRRSLSAAEWRNFCETQAVCSPLYKVLFEDPFIRKMFEKSRNDAAMLDYLYGYRDAVDEPIGPIGESILDFITNSDLGKALQYRQQFIGGLIDGVSQQNDLSILSIDAGYKREVEYSDAIRKLQVSRHLAYDFDLKCLACIEKDYSHLNINPIHGLLHCVPTINAQFGKFDLIYATELLGHRNNQQARDWITWMFESLNDNGFLFMSGFRENTSNTLYRTYLEAFMNWFIQYRTDEELIALFTTLDERKIRAFQLFTDPWCNLTYIILQKGRE